MREQVVDVFCSFCDNFWQGMLVIEVEEKEDIFDQFSFFEIQTSSH